MEEVNPETVRKIEEKLHAVEEVGKEKLHDLGERLHLTRDAHKDANKEEKEPAPAEKKPEAVSAAKK